MEITDDIRDGTRIQTTHTIPIAQIQEMAIMVMVMETGMGKVKRINKQL